MPPPLPQRQAAPSPEHGARSADRWFEDGVGGCLLRSEAGAMGRVLAACPARSWAWFGVSGARAPEAPRGVLLRPRGDGWEGSIRCALPLPLASESLGAVFLQHVLDATGPAAGLLEECERVLAPGGMLWLAALNPWAPSRVRWAGTGLHAHSPGTWQAALRRAGFSGGSVQLQWMGPIWHPRTGPAGVGGVDLLRAGMALTVSKRVHGVVPLEAVRARRWRPVEAPVAGHVAGQGRLGRPGVR